MPGRTVVPLLIAFVALLISSGCTLTYTFEQRIPDGESRLVSHPDLGSPRCIEAGAPGVYMTAYEPDPHTWDGTELEDAEMLYEYRIPYSYRDQRSVRRTGLIVSMIPATATTAAMAYGFVEEDRALTITGAVLSTATLTALTGAVVGYVRYAPRNWPDCSDITPEDTNRAWSYYELRDGETY